MPYKILKKKCKQSSGKKGKYIIVKKSDNKKQSCHTTEEKAKASIRARYANEAILTDYIKLLIESEGPGVFNKYYRDAIRRQEKEEEEKKERDRRRSEEEENIESMSPKELQDYLRRIGLS